MTHLDFRTPTYFKITINLIDIAIITSLIYFIYIYLSFIFLIFQMYAIACQVNLAARLGALEVLILLVSCICHDLDHPGYNNIYQINARTELALRCNIIHMTSIY